MSKARQAFLDGIRDAEQLLDYYHEKTGKGPPPKEAEVLKRAGLIMAMTAWETYVEDRVLEVVEARIAEAGSSEFTIFFKERLDEELRRFNNPNSEKTCRLFKEFARVDVVPRWKWNGYDVARTKSTLDDLMAKRGEAVHRSKPSAAGASPRPHLINKDELRKSIGFLKCLVDATESAFSSTIMQNA